MQAVSDIGVIGLWGVLYDGYFIRHLQQFYCLEIRTVPAPLNIVNSPAFSLFLSPSLSLSHSQAVVMKVGMDSITASYFALFEVINHSFGKCALAKI